MFRLFLKAMSLIVVLPATTLAATLESLEFTVPVSVSALTIHGKVENQDFQIEKNEKGIQSIQISIPADHFKTGIELRDRHMRDKIFTDSQGTVHPIAFKSKNIVCSSTDSCKASGSLSIRGITRPYNLSFTYKDNQAVIQGSVLLSDFEISPPGYLGVNVKNEIVFQGKISESL